MEHIIRERIYPEAASPVPKLRLSPLLLILFIIVFGLAVVIVGLRAVAQYAPALPMPNPFPAYADIFPGQPMSAVKARGFSCRIDYNTYYAPMEDHTPTEESCSFTPREGIFSSIEAKISGGTIYSITFILRDHTLNVGDLARILGMAAIHRFYRTAYFVLPTSIVRADTVGHGKQLSLFLPVWSVTFMELS